MCSIVTKAKVFAGLRHNSQNTNGEITSVEFPNPHEQIEAMMYSNNQQCSIYGHSHAGNR